MSFEVKQFSPYNLSPKLPDGQEGVAIKVNLLETNIFMLNGICQASKKTVEILSDTILHNLSIFGVCGVALSPFAFPVVNRELVFPEDIYEKNGFYRAYFNLVLNDAGLFREPGNYYIAASFQKFLSNTSIIRWGD